MTIDAIISDLIRRELRLRDAAARIAADDVDAAAVLTAEANALERRAEVFAMLRPRQVSENDS